MISPLSNTYRTKLWNSPHRFDFQCRNPLYQKLVKSYTMASANGHNSGNGHHSGSQWVSKEKLDSSLQLCATILDMDFIKRYSLMIKKSYRKVFDILILHCSYKCSIASNWLIWIHISALISFIFALFMQKQKSHHCQNHALEMNKQTFTKHSIVQVYQ